MVETLNMDSKQPIRGLKKVLIITYYWPPAGGGGVQRWLKFTKYLRSHGIEPIIFTARGGEVPVIDASLEKEVPAGVRIIRHPIWEPYTFYKKLLGKKKNDRVYSGFIQDQKASGWKQKLSVFIRGNFFIPDARMFWINPSVKFLKKWLKDEHIDAIISTGPPHSTHRIALGLKRSTGLPWVADFRDPWTQIDFYDQLHLTKWADSRHKRMEQEVLKEADEVVTVSPSWGKGLESLVHREIKIVNNGYDPEDFDRVPDVYPTLFSICHVGSMNADRNPLALWDAIQQLLKEDARFHQFLKIRLIGQVDIAIQKEIDIRELNQYVQKIDFLAHAEIPIQLKNAGILLLPVNKTPNMDGVVPGKLYEYMAAKRPILVIGPPKGDTAQIITDASAGKIFNYDEIEALKQQLILWMNDFEQGNLLIHSGQIDNYSRKNLAGKFAKIVMQSIDKQKLVS
jgi:glycosyltransferase involved in cell wall biosynthesis